MRRWCPEGTIQCGLNIKVSCNVQTTSVSKVLMYWEWISEGFLSLSFVIFDQSSVTPFLNSDSSAKYNKCCSFETCIICKLWNYGRLTLEQIIQIHRPPPTPTDHYPFQSSFSAPVSDFCPFVGFVSMPILFSWSHAFSFAKEFIRLYRLKYLSKVHTNNIS